jgi:hypothetical protein
MRGRILRSTLKANFETADSRGHPVMPAYPIRDRGLEGMMRGVPSALPGGSAT